MALNISFQSQIYRSLPDLERSDAIVNRISKAITLGMLRVGERLPNEIDMSEMFGVAAATLRDALAVLRDQGIVETRRGRNGGTFILKQPQFQLDVMRDWLRNMSIAEIRDLGDEQSAIAAATIRLACDRAEPHELERLQDLARSLVLADSAQARARADSRFHIELAVTAQSTRLTNAEIRLQAETVEVLWSQLGGDFDAERATAEHLALVRAVAEDRSQQGQQLVLEHIRRNTHHLIDTKLALSYATAPKDAE
ncbi:FadR/GntR family transcriptional regulator [Paeniglutamicibacter sp. NPDC091659]|uniref:FadR/GntR family transcriptional regulator n=1 Tax=Paeniglutamicibacter sp. NPDC091659 TaxID=3364389 RepID=UPI00381365F5